MIRIATKEDAKALLDIYKYYVEQTTITFEYETPSVEEFERRIENTLKKYPYLVEEEDGKIYGYTYAGPFKERAAYDWSVETTIYVDKDARGKYHQCRCMHYLSRTRRRICNKKQCTIPHTFRISYGGEIL